MQYDEIIVKYVEGKLVPGIEWLTQQLDKDPQVISNSSREKVALRKFLCNIEEQFADFLNNPDEDPRDELDESDLYGDDDIIVGPGKDTAVDFMDPPEDEDMEDDYGLDFYPDEEDDDEDM